MSTAPVNIPMFDPSGQVRQIPMPSVKDALAAGGKLAVRMADPQGVERWIPHDVYPQAVNAGGKVLENPLTQQPEGFWHSLGAVFGITPEQLSAGQAQQQALVAKHGGGVGGAFKAAAEETFTNPQTYGPPIAMAATAIHEAPRLVHKAIAEEKASQAALQQGKVGEFFGHQAGVAGYGAATALSPVGGGTIAKAGEQLGAGNVRGAAGTTTGILAPFAVAAGAKPLARAIVKPVAPLLPKIVQIEGVDMPVLTGEATPQTVPGVRAEAAAGRLQTSLKSQGIRAGKFQEIAAKQQAATKQVIQNVAAKTAGMTDVTAAAEPGPAMQSAADATFSKARPMYQALDASLTTVPETADTVSAIVKQAQARAAKLGAQFTDTSETAAAEATYQKAVSDYRLTGDAAAKLRTSMGLPETPAEAAQPLESVLKTRSELLKMARASSDPAMQRAIYQEVDSMNAAVETALRASNTPGLVENWQQANRLWTKGYALERVSESLQKAVRGTPIEAQVPGLQPQPPHISGARLVQELNKLDSRGDLSKAFSPAQKTALRNVADLLDRSQKTRIGQTTLVKGGYSPHSMAWHTVTDIIKSVGSAPFVKIMTSESGARLMNRVINAQTSEAAATTGAALKAQAGVPQYAFRSRSVGDQGITATGSHAQAGLDESQIRSYMPGREAAEGKPQELIKVDISKLPPDSYTVHSKNGFDWVQFHKDVPEHMIEPASPATGVTSPAVRAENAFYTQARAKLGASATPEQVQARVQQMKAQGVQMPAPPPSIVHRATTGAHPLTGAQRSAAIGAVMSQLKSGEISEQDADRQIQRINRGGGRKLVRMPEAP